MERKAVSGMMLALLLVSMLTLAFNIEPAKASGTVYIKADGSVEGTTDISTVDNVTYTFTDNIFDEIVVERSNIVVDGNGTTLQGSGSGLGFNLTSVSNVTIKNTNIKNFNYGVYLFSSSNDNTVSGNTITNNTIVGVYFIGSSNNTVSGNNITNNIDAGVVLSLSSNNTVSGNNITNNAHTSVGLISSSNDNTVSGNNITNNTEGVYLGSSSNNTVSGNNITNNAIGIRLDYSSNDNTVSGNTITNNTNGVYVFSSSNDNTVSGNTITNSTNSGVRLILSSNNTVSGNNITNNTPYGVYLRSSSNDNTVSGNTITNNGGGVYLFLSSSDNTVSGNNMTNNTYGIRLDSSSNDNTVSGNNMTNNTSYGVWLSSSSDNNTVSGNTITNNTIYGVYLSSSSNNTVSGNNITNNYSGVYLLSSSNDNTVSGNNMTNNACGIHLDLSSNDNTVSGNTITNNTSYGVWLSSSSDNNTVSGNTITNNTLYGVLSVSSNDNTVSGNTITNNTLYGVLSVSSNDNTVSGNNMTNNAYGIRLDSSSNDNTVSGNTITNSTAYGVWLSVSSNSNIVSSNNITNNSDGIYLENSSNNSIYHNNFVDNTQQVFSGNSTNVWDNGYPSGGNYWSNYNGTDSYSGPNQDQSDSDGIGDTPYVIDANNQDNYPFMGPWQALATQVVSTESTGNSQYPSLAVDSNGNIHVAWQDNTNYTGSGTDYDIFYKKYEVGIGWTNTTVVSTNSTAGSIFPSLAVDSSGNVHIAWQDYTNYAGSGNDLDIFYKRYEVGVGWTNTEVVSTENNTASSLYPSLAVDPSGNIHIAWYDYTNYAGSGADSDIFYKRYEVGVGWTITEVVSTENSTGNSSQPSLAVDSSGNVHIAWEDYTNYTGSGNDMDIFYKRYEVGVGWTTTEVVSTNSTLFSASPSLAVDSSGNVHIAWRDNTNYTGSGTDWDIFYKRYEVGVGWTITEVVSTESISSSAFPSLDVDLARNVHVAWFDNTNYTGSGTDWDIFYKRYEIGLNWTLTQVVSTESTAHSMYPSLAVDLAGNVHVAWEDLTNYAVSGPDWDIFYKYLRVHSTQYPWSMFHHNLRHTGYTESPAPNTNQTLWNYTTGGSVWSSPAVTDGMVFVGSNDGNVYALDQHTGAHIWNYTTGGYVSSPAVVDGKVFVGSDDHKVYCLDATTGAHIWNYTTGGWVWSSPAVVDGKVFVGSDDNKTYCLDATTGAHTWNYTTGGWVDSPAVADGKVYIGSLDDKVYCLDAANGTHIWNYTTGGWVESSPAVADGKVYVGSYDDKVYCLDAANGTHIWNYTTGGWVESSPAVADGKVYVGSHDGNVYCLDAANGTHIWNYTTGGWVYSSPAVADGKVYVGSWDNKTYCLNASTSAHIWNYTTGNAVYSSPAVADGMVFIGSDDGVVYAFGNIIRVPEDYPTVQEAIDAADPEATIIIAPGTYTENLIINKPLTIIGKMGSSTTFDGGGSGIAINITNTSHVTITNIEITDYDQGILIDNSSECQIYNNVMYLINDNGIVADGDNAANNLIYSNTISSNHVAIDITESSTGNTIYGNTISENQVGINVGHSTGNTIYWNSFVNNVYQVNMSNPSDNAWDNGYPSGGNYWSNYQGEDVDGNGIGDTPYIIDENNQDNYPLMKPYGGSYDIGITDVTPSKTVVEQCHNINITITILNYGIYTETRNIEIYANTTLIGFQSVTLTSRTPKNITFTWNTTGFAYGNYTISATATTVPDETAIADNTYIDDTVFVTILGDIDGDGDVDSYDFYLFSGKYGSSIGDPSYIPEADLDGDGDVDSYDFYLFSGKYGQTI